MAIRRTRKPELAGLSGDWYWEQDAELRFTRVEVQSDTAGEQELARRVLGKRRWETGIEVEGGWEAHRALLAARAPFRDVLMWRDFEDGSRRYLSVSGEPLFGPGERFIGYRGVGRDVTAQKRGEQLLRLQHAVTQRLAEAPSAAEAAEGALRAICETEGWDCAELWRLDPAAGVMRRFAEWAQPGVPEARRFVDASRGLEYTQQDGLIGVAWRTAKPLWLADSLRDPRARRAAIAEETGRRAALICPVSSEGRVAGMLTFACRRIRQPDQALLQALSAFTTQLGLFLRRADAEARLRRSEERFRRTFELAGVGVAHLGLDRRFQRVNRRMCEIFGYTEAEIIGRTGRELSHPDDLDVVNSYRPRLYAGEIDEVRGEKRYLRKDGSVVWVAYTFAVERDAAGAPVYEIAIYDDISARKEMEQALRDSEGRFRGLTLMSSDWYWELDAEFRYTRLEGRGVTGADWQSGVEVEGGWEAHRALLRARKPFHEVLMWRPMPDGSQRYARVSGEPIYAADGTFAGYRGVGRDITEEKRREQLLRLEHGVASALSEARSADRGLDAVIRLVCEAEGWDCGRYFEVDAQADELVFRRDWMRPGASVEAFMRASRALRFKRGQSLAGLAWSSATPIWSSDTSKDSRLMPHSILASAPRGAFIFSAMAEGETVGVLSFTSESVRPPDERLLQAARVIGVQIGQFLRRMQAEASLRDSEARFRSLTEMSSDFFWETDAQHRFVDLVHGPSYSERMGRIVGHTAWDLPYTHPDAAGWAAIRATMDEQRLFRDFEFGRPWPDGSVRYFSVNGDPHFAADGSFAGYRGVGRDITDIVLARERIASLAYHDPLTGLDNRISLRPALEKAVDRTRRRASRLAGLFLDLDGFKSINDLYGHDAGDRLLVEAARRLRAGLRGSDPVARLGGDEFFIVLEDIHDAAPAERVANKLLEALREPYDIGVGKPVHVFASIGVSVFPDDAGDADTLIKHADMAMYSAKQAGKNACRFFKAGAAANDGRADEESERAG